MVRIRLMRNGAKKRPYYKVVVADSRSPRDGRFIEIIGRYHPLSKEEPVVLKEDRIKYWVSQGAQPSKVVSDLMRKQGIK